VTAHARHHHADAAADQVRDMLADLTRTRSHREHLTATVGHTTVGHSHFTKVPPLLAQLRYADWTKGTERGGSGYESRPAASIEALTVLSTIDLEASRWVRDLGEDDPATTIGCVALLGGLMASTTRCRRHNALVDREAGKVTCCTWHAVARDVGRWWTQARIVTGWDLPAWRPDNTCPCCGVRRSLRIRLSERIGLCVECHETWSPNSDPGYQVLADHIREESEAGRPGLRVPVGPCSCEWPPAAVATELGLAKLCPRCGSSTCVNAVRSTGRKAV
jgi:hypothetical protein